MFVCECLSVMWHMWRYPIPFPMRLALCAWPVPRVNQSWCRHLRRLRSKLIFKNCALKCHINYVTYLRAKPPPPEAGSAYRVCDRWEREREMRREGERSAARAQHGSNCKRRKEHHGKWKFCNRTIFQLPGKCKNRRDTLDGKCCFRGKLCTLSGWRVAANGMKREEKQTARYFCTISQWPRQLWGACVWVLVYWCVCVCVCTSRAQTDYRLSRRRRRRRRLAASEAACRELLTPHRKCACQPVCVCACVLPFVLYEFS